MLELNYDQLAAELLRALRGHRSQEAFRRQLHYRSNVAYFWESGRRAPSATEAHRVAQRMGVDVIDIYYLHRVEGVVVDTAGADPDAIADVRDAVANGGVEAGAAQVGDDLIDSFAVAGDPDQVAERLQRYADAGLRGALAWHVLGPDPTRGYGCWLGRCGHRSAAPDLRGHTSVSPTLTKLPRVD